MKAILCVLIIIVMYSCSNKRDNDIRVANTMISYYHALIEYEDSVDTMPMDYRLSLRDSLEHWYNVRHELIISK